MSAKTKRIKAQKIRAWVDHPGAPTEDAYLIKQSDVRALAEQLLDHMDIGFDQIPGDRLKNLRENKLIAVLYALKQVGITPGRARKGKQ